MGRLVVLLFLLFGVYSQVLASYTPDYYAESGTSSQLEYTHNHPAEHINPFSGSLHLDFEDVRVRNNGGMDIVVRRVYSNYQDKGSAPFVKSLYGVGWNITYGRIFHNSPYICNDNGSKPVLELPDGSRQQLYRATEH
ncbi:MAG: hypothetical protein MI754_09990, partial [Chromatiales bacterium]|nr:hypothetical protein [Chromatiales bacterium]